LPQSWQKPLEKQTFSCKYFVSADRAKGRPALRDG
jgi:hypothetical protein